MATGFLPRLFGYDLDAIASLPQSHRGRLEIISWAEMSVPVMAATGSGYSGYLLAASPIAGAIAAMVALFVVLNMQRCLDAGSGYAYQLDPAKIDSWKPQPLGAVVLACFAAGFAQPWMLWWRASELDLVVASERKTLTEQFVSAAAQYSRAGIEALQSEIGTLAERIQRERGGNPGGASRLLDQDEAELAFAKQSLSEAQQELKSRAGAERAKFEAQVRDSPFLLTRVQQVWTHSVWAGFWTLAAALLGALPGFLRRVVFLASVRAYECDRVMRTRQRVLRDWEDARDEQASLLTGFNPGFQPSPPKFEDPPFNSQPLLLGRERGVRVKRRPRPGELGPFRSS